MFGQNPSWSKEKIAEACGVSRTALYGWLRDSRFINLIENYEADPQLSLATQEDLIASLTDEEKVSLLSELEAGYNTQPSRFEKLSEELGRLSQRLHSASTSRKITISSEINKLVGRIKLQIHPAESIFYNNDGSLKLVTEANFYALGAELEELAIYTCVLTGADYDDARLPARLNYAIGASIKYGIPIDLVEVD